MKKSTQYRVCHLKDGRRFYMIFNSDLMPLCWAQKAGDASTYTGRETAKIAATNLEAHLQAHGAAGRVLVVPARGGMEISR